MKVFRHVLLVGDLAGREHFHVGDEAMLECNLLMLRRLLPQARFSLMSADPSASADRYAAQAVSRLGFSAVSADRQSELWQIECWLALARTAPEQLPEALHALLQADLLVISGGGNLSSTWPDYILERLAMVRLARQQDIPVLILGQTLGPQLSEIDRRLLVEILAAATWVGLREASSVALALTLGVPLAHIDYQLDDAINLPPRPVPWLATAWPAAESRGPLIALTLHPLFAGAVREHWLDGLAAELDQVIAELGARLLFIPHLADWQGEEDLGDKAVGLALSGRLRRPEALHVLDVQDAGTTAWLTQQADLLVSSRYHPLVFALAAQRPCLGLPTDAYTLIKLQGALRHAGCEADLLVLREQGWPGLAQRIISQFRGAALRACDRQWESRCKRQVEDRERRLAGWLDELQQGLQPTPDTDSSELLVALASLAGGSAQESLLAAREVELRGSVEHWRATADAATAYVSDLQVALHRSHEEYDRLSNALDEANRRAELAEAYARSLECEREQQRLSGSPEKKHDPT
jgi:polysaccharide pyruvyl transferase WcaK-like protein